MHRPTTASAVRRKLSSAATASLLGLLLFIVGCSPDSVDLTGLQGGLHLMKLNDITYRMISQPTMLANEHNLLPYDTVRRQKKTVVLNGDAEGLQAGTPVYTLDDYTPGFRLAVTQGRELIIYQAERNPHAIKAGDVLDISGRVQRIGVWLDGDRSETASINESAQIKTLVEMVMESPYSHDPILNSGTRQVWIRFFLADGTDIVNAFWLDSGVLGAGIQLPQEFGAMIWDALITQGQSG